MTLGSAPAVGTCAVDTVARGRYKAACMTSGSSLAALPAQRRTRGRLHAAGGRAQRVRALAP